MAAIDTPISNTNDHVNSNSNGSNNVLSDKVSRALQVRTDTPAMRAALDALANLPTNHEYDLLASGLGHSGSSGNSHRSSTSGEGRVIDAKSVRAAIERDALLSALDFQKELQKLGRDATKLRERVETVAQVASLLKQRAETQIIIDSGGHQDNKNNNEDESNGITQQGDNNEIYGAEYPSRKLDAWEEERKLVSHLAYSHKAYVEARERQLAVNNFLDKFDLSEDEARLLDHYNFEGFVASERYIDGDGHNPWRHPNAAVHIISNPSQDVIDDAMAFLNALERLAVIRGELTKTFGRGEEHSHVSENILEVGTGRGANYAEQSLGTHSALRMMENLAYRQEKAHERLYQFIQIFLGIGSASSSPNAMMIPTSSSDNGRSYNSASHGVLGRFHDDDDMDEAFNHPIIRRSVYVLRHSPAHHVHELELISAGRRTEVTRRFLLALTSGYGGMVPLEIKAYDPVGYVGDMLAFAFRAFRVEGELCKTLLTWNDDTQSIDQREVKEEQRSNNDASSDDHQPGEDDEQDIISKPMNAASMLAQSMSGLARPLRARVSQVVLSLASQGRSGSYDDMTIHQVVDAADENDDASLSLNRLVALFSICGLFRFYCSAVRKALDKLDEGGHAQNPFFITCEESLTEASDAYIASLRAFGAMLNDYSSTSSEAQLVERVIIRISEERIASPGFSDDVQSFSESESVIDLQLSLSVLVATMIEAVKPHLKTLDDCASLKSALNVAVQCGLDPIESNEWNEFTNEMANSLVDSLVDSETNDVLQNCGLGGVRSALRHMDSIYVSGMTMASYPGLAQHDMELSIKKFYSSLISPPIPSFEDSIKDPELRKIARSKTAQRVVDVYQQLYNSINSEKGGYTDVSFLGHDPDQVKTLLSI